MFAHVTIRARLIGALLVLLLLISGLGGFSYLRLQALSAATNDLGANALPSSRVLGKTAADFESLRSRQLAYLVSGEERRLPVGLGLQLPTSALMFTCPALVATAFAAREGGGAGVRRAQPSRRPPAPTPASEG